MNFFSSYFSFLSLQLFSSLILYILPYFWSKYKFYLTILSELTFKQPSYHLFSCFCQTWGVGMGNMAWLGPSFSSFYRVRIWNKGQLLPRTVITLAFLPPFIYSLGMGLENLAGCVLWPCYRVVGGVGHGTALTDDITTLIFMYAQCSQDFVSLTCSVLVHLTCPALLSHIIQNPAPTSVLQQKFLLSLSQIFPFFLAWHRWARLLEQQSPITL